MSIASILSIARTAISAQQVAINTTAQNVANAETEGYSRQRVELAAKYPMLTPFGSLGTGVEVASVIRARDALLDASFRRESGSSAGSTLRRDLMSRIERVFGEPSDTGLASAMDAFWSSWSDLANNPNNPAAQSAVQQSGAQVARMLNDFDRRFGELRVQAGDQLASDLSQFNALAKQVAELNHEITAAEVGGREAPDLRDARDLALDAMAKLANVTVVANANGRVSVLLGGANVVDEDTAKEIAIGGTATAPAITLKGRTDALQNVGGTLEASIGVLAGDLPAAQQALDGLARGLVSAVNAIHRGGKTPAGDLITNPALPTDPSNVDFFDPTGVSASTIRLSSAVANDARTIATGSTAGGENDVALALASLRDSVGSAALRARMGDAAYDAQVGIPGTTSFADHYRTIVTRTGSEAAAAGRDATVYTTLAEQADTRRLSVSSVSVDEELTALIAHQHAFQAASKLVNAADEMAQAVLDMVR